MTRTSRVNPKATLRPSKMELLASWLPDQPWFKGNVADLELVAKFRFEDPDGEVGLDCMVVSSAGELYFVPVTWRANPLPSWARLIGELQHSELGTRYCYDAATDPVFLSELKRVIEEGDTQSQVLTEDGAVVAQSVEVRGNGKALPRNQLRIVHRLGEYFPGSAKLVATWEYQGHKREDIFAAGQ